MERFLCPPCGHTVSVLLANRLPYRPLEVDRLQGAFDAQAEVGTGLDPPPEPIEAGCLQRAWNRFLTRVQVLQDALGQMLPAELPTAPQLWIQLLGIGQRTIRASRAHISTNRKPKKAVPQSLQSIGDAIRFKRFEKGLSQSQLAALLGVPKVLVKRWERDPQVPNPEAWLQLARCLNIDLSVFNLTLNS